MKEFSFEEAYYFFTALEFEQCPWRCPICGERCGGVKGHKGVHQFLTTIVRHNLRRRGGY